jgi:hypothetical protein
LFKSVPLGVIAWTVAVVAPEATVVVISDLDFTMNTAAMSVVFWRDDQNGHDTTTHNLDPLQFWLLSAQLVPGN